MYIDYKDKKFEKLCQDKRKLIRKYGPQNARKIVQRMNELTAIESLGLMLEFRIGRCHQLKENLKGMFALDLEHPLRLIFEPIFEEEANLNQVDYYKVKKVRVVGVFDYHGQ
ncbi:hypothetical protein Tfer_1098 [Thermincola ferriacetica]|uniref:Plasmid maintenance system killer protein n=1 Tax=Thermincola ferriacetica TaxID=281456 RepID=A0A0L6W3R2_9FIRM|nr:plasmid maintenance system killer protein [Thermincola ferriacetica]KNZ70222.1 hypothetical protein Tfer_1098 [Thermincola ferriacetica]